MRRAGGALLAMALAAPWLTTSSPTVAAGEEVVVEYDAYEGCPGRAEFLAAIAARAPDVHVVTAKEGARTFRVRIVHFGSGGKKSRGTVDSVDGSGKATNVRSLVGERCEDVAQALSIVVALAIAPGSAGKETAGSSANANPSTTSAPSSTSIVPDIDPPKVAPSTEGEGWHLAASVGDRLRLFATPHPANGIEVAIELAPPGERARLRLGYGDAIDPAFGGGGDAHFHFSVGRLDACVPVTVGSWLAGCAGVEAGRLRGEGVEIAHPSVANATWLALDLGAALRVPFGSVVGLDLEGGAAIPLLHPRFVFDTPHAVIHETPKFTAFFAISLRVRFL